MSERVEIKMYQIWYTEPSGRKYLVAATDNLEKWLEHHNSLREEEDYETLLDFEIEEDYFLMFDV